MPLTRGPIVYVMGPSGAGKDSLLRFARANIDAHEGIAFAHRYITRPPDASGENHIALSQDEFAERRARGLFAFHWQAHETNYGIGIEIEDWRSAGLLVVVNGSRAHFAGLAAQAGDIAPVLIMAEPGVLARRLAQRGRETEAEILARLRRQTDSPGPGPCAVIDNSGSLEIAGRRFIEILRETAGLAVHA